MKSFIAGLSATQNSALATLPSQPTSASLAEALIIEIPEYGSLSSNDVRLIYLIGHSQISGKGSNADATSQERAFNNSVMWNGGSFTDFTVPATGEHGRELGINAYYKTYFDASHTQNLHMAKYVIRGACPYTIFILGTKYFNYFWNNIFVPSVNYLIAQGKIPTIHLIHDIFLGLDVQGVGETNRYDLRASVNSLLYLLKYSNINISFTGDGEPTGAQGSPNNILSNASIKAYADAKPVYFKYADKLNQPTNDGIHLNYAGLKYVALAQLQHIKDQPLIKITRLLTPIVDATLITYKGNVTQRDIISIKTDKAFDVLVQSDGVRFEQKNTMEFGLDVRFQRAGFITLIGNLSGITRFESPYSAIYAEFDFIEKYGATLNYIDIRGNTLQVTVGALDYSNDKQLEYLVTGNVSNGTLLIAGSQVGLTVGARTNYDTLITRGWTIDVARP